MGYFAALDRAGRVGTPHVTSMCFHVKESATAPKVKRLSLTDRVSVAPTRGRAMSSGGEGLSWVSGAPRLSGGESSRRAGVGSLLARPA